MAKESAKAKKAREAAEAAAKAQAGGTRNLLAEAVNARATNTPLMATQAEMAALLADPRGPLVEFNSNLVAGDKIAFRATELGMSVHANPGQAAAPQAPASAAWGAPGGAPAPQAPAPAAPAPAPAGGKTFNFAAGVPLPAPRRGGRGSTVYGFEQMTVGQSFFVPTTTDNPNPAKRIASTVSSASARLEPKKFIVRSVIADATMAAAWGVAVGAKGAGIWRTE